MYNFLVLITGIALISTITFLTLMLKSKKKSIRRRRMMQFMIISLVIMLAVPSLYAANDNDGYQGGNPVVVNNDNSTTKTDKNGYYNYKIYSTTKAKVTIHNSPYIIKKSNGKNSAQAIVKLPSNVKNTNIGYSASANGKPDAEDAYSVYNNSDAYKQIQAGKKKKAQAKESQEAKQEEADKKKQEHEKQVKEAQFKAQYPPIESALSNPLKATQSQQARSYMIQGKVIDMAAYPTGMQYIVQDSEGNKFFTFVNKGELKGGPRANLDDQLTIYAGNIFPDTISQNEVDNGMIASHAGEKVTNALADRAYLKREE